MNESIKIMSIEAKDLFGAMNHEVGSKEYQIRGADGRVSLKKFSNALDWSLDSIKLEEVYREKTGRDDFYFCAGRHRYTKNVICVTFKYSYKEYNLAGKNTYIKNGYNYRDCVFNNGSYILDGELIGIQTNVAVEEPLSDELLSPYFRYSNGFYEQTGVIHTIMDKSGLRSYLYENGFKCDGIEYVRYKRSSGSSRVGKCLFVNKELAADMAEWDKCGLDIVEGQKLDLAAWEAYIALSMSSIIDTITIPLDSVLVIDDYESEFDDKVIAVEDVDGKLVSSKRDTKVVNSIWDGQSLMDESLFGEYSDKGMLLLRNRFFKSCCFNTKLQKWFADNGITDISQLKGFTLADSIDKIKLVTTPSSIKYVKFGTIEQWMKNVSSTFGIVKYEKKPYPFDGRMVQAHYQLFNTLHLSYAEMEKILAPSLSYIEKLRRDPAVLRYDIQYPRDDGSGVWKSLESKNEIVFRMIGLNDKFTQTKLYYDFRDDLIKSNIRNLKRGHVLVNGNYSTLAGNVVEMLKAAIGKFDGRSELGAGNVHSKRFEYDRTILCSRSPHVCAGNILLVHNVENKLIDTYFNFSTEIVAINAIGENIQQRLNG